MKISRLITTAMYDHTNRPEDCISVQTAVVSCSVRKPYKPIMPVVREADNKWPAYTSSVYNATIGFMQGDKNTATLGLVCKHNLE